MRVILAPSPSAKHFVVLRFLGRVQHGDVEVADSLLPVLAILRGDGGERVVMAHHLGVGADLGWIARRRALVDIAVRVVGVQQDHRQFRRHALQVEAVAPQRALADERHLPDRIERKRYAAPLGPARHDGDQNDFGVEREVLGGQYLVRQQVGQDHAMHGVAVVQPGQFFVEIVGAAGLLEPRLQSGQRAVHLIGVHQIFAIDDDRFVLNRRPLPSHNVAQKVKGPFGDGLRLRQRRCKNQDRGECGSSHRQNLAIAESERTVCRDDRSNAA